MTKTVVFRLPFPLLIVLISKKRIFRVHMIKDLLKLISQTIKISKYIQSSSAIYFNCSILMQYKKNIAGNYLIKTETVFTPWDLCSPSGSTFLKNFLIYYQKEHINELQAGIIMKTLWDILQIQDIFQSEIQGEHKINYSTYCAFYLFLLFSPLTNSSMNFDKCIES